MAYRISGAGLAPVPTEQQIDARFTDRRLRAAFVNCAHALGGAPHAAYHEQARAEKRGLRPDERLVEVLQPALLKARQKGPIATQLTVQAIEEYLDLVKAEVFRVLPPASAQQERDMTLTLHREGTEALNALFADGLQPSGTMRTRCVREVRELVDAGMRWLRTVTHVPSSPSDARLAR